LSYFEGCQNLFPKLEYIFKHALTREVAYESLLQQKRKEIHKNIVLTQDIIFDYLKSGELSPVLNLNY